MSLSLPAIVLLALNLGLVWLLMAAPIGRRTIVMRRVLPARAGLIWSMVHPLGKQATWAPGLIESRAVDDGARVLQRLNHHDRRGRPIERLLEIEDFHAGPDHAYAARVIEDTALDASFWSAYAERRTVRPVDAGAELTVEMTDRYRGLAFLLFRYFMLGREMRQLDTWLRTGEAKSGGVMEHPLTQLGLALASTVMMWPFFGMNWHGLILSSILTVVIILHEFGHMAAYRVFGHKRVRMIFIPLLGGVAVGDRPYNSVLEVAICALMGAGFSALLAPVVMAAYWVSPPQSLFHNEIVLLFLLVLGAFNLLNLLPMTRFDGGQVLRQVFPTRDGIMGASFLVTAGILWTGWRMGIPVQALYGGLAVMAILSFTSHNSVKPREALDEMSAGARLNVGLGYYTVLAIHANALIFAADRLFG